MTENTQRIAELQRELGANPASRQFYQLGELLRRDGRFSEATDVLNAGLVHHPRYMAAWVALGRACLEEGKAREAVHGLEQALVLDAQNPVAWRLLGEARLVLGDRLGALDAMSRCLELVPGDDVLQAAVDALASETLPPGPPPEYAPMPESAGAPPAEPAAAETVFGVEPPDAVPAAPDAFPASPAGPGEGAAAPEPFLTARTAPQEAPDVFGSAPAADEPFAAAAATPGPPAAGPFDEAAPAAVFPGAFELRPEPPAMVETPLLPAQGVFEAPPVAPPVAAAVAEPLLAAVPPEHPEETAPPLFAAPVGVPAEPPAVVEAAPAPTSAGMEIFAAPAPEEEPAPRADRPVAPAVPASETPVEPPPSIALARLYLQQQAPDEAVRALERLLEREPANVEASDLLALVRDMMMPLPEAPPPLAPRERKIAALQRWLASLTLGWERAAR